MPKGVYKHNMMGVKHPNWKGEEASYLAKHNRIKVRFGKADKCEGKNCKKITKFYEWANKSGLYLTKRSDWIKLCRSCHRSYDMTPEKIYIQSKRMKKYWEGNSIMKQRYSIIAKKQWKIRIKNKKG